MNSLLQADIANVLKDIISLLSVGVLTVVFPLIKKVGASVLAKIPATERVFLEAAAKDAVIFVEAHSTTFGGKAKFELAVNRVVTVLEDHGIKISATDIEQAIEAAYQQVKELNITPAAPVVPAEPVAPVVAPAEPVAPATPAEPTK